jgi:hypothetical protein
MGVRYPEAEWVPWKWNPSDPAFYFGQNNPEAAVLHVAEGYESTIRTWAANGFTGASWHYTVCRDGRVLQHLDHGDGGYHAGIAQYRRNGVKNPDPTWALWKGWGVNINTYTIGIEHEGFTGTPMTAEQASASRNLCRWLADVIGFAMDRDHFPPHADIALIDRANDFNKPELREQHYAYLFEPEQPVPPIPSPWLTAHESAGLQLALGDGALALPQSRTVLWQDFNVGPTFDGSPAYTLKAGEEVDVYHVFRRPR